MFLVNKSHCQYVGHCARCWVDRHKEGLVPALKDTQFTDGSGARCKPSPFIFIHSTIFFLQVTSVLGTLQQELYNS